MPISFRCKCGRRIKVPDTHLGKAGNCPACRCVLRLVAPAFGGGDGGEHGFRAVLEVVAGPDRVGEMILLGGPGPIEVGRHPEKHLVLGGHRVSRSHCHLLREKGGWRVEDLKSTSGVFLNGEKLQAGPLQDGDTLRVGEYQLRYSSSVDALADAALPPPFGAFAETAGADPIGASAAVGETNASKHDPDENIGASLLADDLDGDSLYHLGDGDVIALAPPVSEAAVQVTPYVASGGPVCPSCERSLAPNAKICVACGIDLKTGRAILTSHGADLDTIYERTEQTIRWLSWLIWAGIFPVASEAFGIRKPYVTWSIAAITVLTSFAFWFAVIGGSETAADYMLWIGKPETDPGVIAELYEKEQYGDPQAFKAEFEKARQEQARKGLKPLPLDKVDGDDETEFQRQLTLRHEAILSAHHALPPEKQCVGQFAASQLITHAFLHGGIFHLAGNLLFLFVFGSRVNALVGNLSMIVLYPLLAILAAFIPMMVDQDSIPFPSLGASGAIMGLAGMYFVLMPIHNMHMAAWIRLGLVGLFRLGFKLFAVRGFWVVLFYIAFDVLATVRGVEDGVGHWAHLGGFIFGMAIGLLLLFTRLVNCRGGDIVSALLGKYAWAFIGKPDLNRRAPLEYGW